MAGKNGGMMSLREFSRLAGVSPATVSRVFSGKGLVAARTRERILDLARATHFRPNPLGQVVFGGETRSIGVLLCNLNVSYFVDIAVAVQERLLEDGYLPVVLLSQTGASPIRTRQGLRRLLDHRVDGVLFMLSDQTMTPENLAELTRARLPLLCLDAHPIPVDCDVVDTDDAQGARLLAEHLLALGHRSFGAYHMGRPEGNVYSRLTTFREIVLNAGGTLPERHIVLARPGEEAENHRRLREVLAAPDRPGAVFATTDVQVVGLYRAAREEGLAIPADLSVVGFADLQYASFLTPPLTTVRQDGFAVGHAAAERILRRLREPDLPVEVHLIPTSLQVRESTAPPARWI